MDELQIESTWSDPALRRFGASGTERLETPFEQAFAGNVESTAHRT